jgi:hypothetical protein
MDARVAALGAGSYQCQYTLSLGTIATYVHFYIELALQIAIESERFFPDCATEACNRVNSSVSGPRREGLGPKNPWQLQGDNW